MKLASSSSLMRDKERNDETGARGENNNKAFESILGVERDIITTIMMMKIRIIIIVIIILIIIIHIITMAMIAL